LPGHVDRELGDPRVAVARPVGGGGGEGDDGAAVLDHDDGVDAVEPGGHVGGAARPRLEGGDAVGDALVVDGGDGRGVGGGGGAGLHGVTRRLARGRWSAGG